ncbi:hypothetical protein O2K51_07305 [Apibacter raozihei]|uniref:hypothetical protein n=1 Tax=Apibacter raozihei TaxID=2500547 RepID=UPI000FE3C4C2|nr:hypothetical protein [Apibacter raozihei]
MAILEKQQRGIACEYYVAGELSRLGYNVSITFGNTKSIDLLLEKNDFTIAIQVKGIQRTKSICWNLDKTKVKSNILYVLVNLHADQIDKKPEFFVLTATEILEQFINSPKQGEKRTYLNYNRIKNNLNFKNNWSKIDLIMKKGDEKINFITTGKYLSIWQFYLDHIINALLSSKPINSLQLNPILFSEAGSRQSYSFRINYSGGRVTNNLDSSAVARDLDKVLTVHKHLLKNTIIKLSKDFELRIENY